MSSGLVNRLKWGDAIQVNGVPVHTNHPVQPGDLITVRMEEEVPEYPAEDGPLEILYEDDYLLAVDKPAGMLIHPSHSQFGGTLANFVQGYYLRTNQHCAFHPLTRLDRDTFGIVLLAKNSHAHALLQAQKPSKAYHALVYGAPAEDQGTVEAPIARKPLPSLLREISPAGKPCRTEYRVLERMGQTSLLELRPITGRTHQLRLHCAHLGCPILGDPQYNSLASKAYSDTLGLSTQRLCAKWLEFSHPITGEAMLLESGQSAADAATKKQILSADFDIPRSQKMERVMNAMCNLSDGVFQRGMEKGMERGLEQGDVSSIRNVMESLGVSLEQAMDILKIHGEKREKYSRLLAEV